MGQKYKFSDTETMLSSSFQESTVHPVGLKPNKAASPLLFVGPGHSFSMKRVFFLQTR